MLLLGTAIAHAGAACATAVPQCAALVDDMFLGMRDRECRAMYAVLLKARIADHDLMQAVDCPICAVG